MTGEAWDQTTAPWKLFLYQGTRTNARTADTKDFAMQMLMAIQEGFLKIFVQSTYENLLNSINNFPKPFFWYGGRVRIHATL